MDSASVKNAADPKQVKRAARTDREKRTRYLGALRQAMSTELGRLVFWELLSKARVFESIFHASAAIYYHSGRQDYGHELMADLMAADEELYVRMATEARTRDKQERDSNEASHTATAEESSHGSS